MKPKIKSNIRPKAVMPRREDTRSRMICLDNHKKQHKCLINKQINKLIN